MKPIPFTQFLLHNGTPRQTTIGRPDPIADQAEELIKAGCRLEAEILTTGEVSLTVERGEETLAIEIVPTGPTVLETVDKVICDAHRQIQNKFNPAFSE